MTENKEIKCNENKKCKMCGKEINERNKVVFYKRSGKKNATSLVWHMNCHNYILTS